MYIKPAITREEALALIADHPAPEIPPGFIAVGRGPSDSQTVAGDMGFFEREGVEDRDCEIIGYTTNPGLKSADWRPGRAGIWENWEYAVWEEDVRNGAFPQFRHLLPESSIPVTHEF